MATKAAAKDFPCRDCDVRDEAICSALDALELRELKSISTSVSLPEGRMVFLEGDEYRYLFNVVRGVIRMSKGLPDGRRQITGFMFPGDFLGLSVGGRYSYTAETIGPSKLCRFDRRRLMAIADRHPKLERKLLRLASNELVQAQEHFLILGQKSAIERVTTALLKLAERLGQNVDEGCTVTLPMTREDMADYLGLSFETISRVISALRKSGVIQLSSAREVHIPNTVALRRLTGDI